MDGLPPSGRVLAVDHDRLFKELLTTFFFEFPDLFFPALAAQIHRKSIESLSQELFPNLLDGAEYRADTLGKEGPGRLFRDSCRTPSEAPATFPRRFFRYFSAIFEKHGLPVCPIVVYSHDAPHKPQPGVYKIDFPDGEVLRFRYRVVQLMVTLRLDRARMRLIAGFVDTYLRLNQAPSLQPGRALSS